MAYVGAPFDFDLFISYSHGADADGTPYLQQWSAAFALELERELRADRKFRNDLRLFLDQDDRPGLGLDPLTPLTPQLHEKIAKSALLVVLMSPDYLASNWCKDERESWCAQQVQLGLPAENRLAVVKIWPTTDPWPPALTDTSGQPLVGFPFFAQDGGVARPLGWTELPGPFGSDFRKALLGIVGRIYPRLEEVRARLEELRRAKADADKLQQSGQSIYLQGRADRAAVWERVGLELTSHGYVVVPGSPDPVSGDQKELQRLRDQRVMALRDCDALLLVGTDDAQALDQDLVVVGKHDRQSARARWNKLLPCGLLDTVGAGIDTPVRKATARVVQAEWIDGTQTPWTPKVQQWLAAKGAHSEPRI
jgi:hypothetical protein